MGGGPGGWVSDSRPPPLVLTSSGGFCVIMLAGFCLPFVLKQMPPRLGNSFPVHVCRHDAKTVLWLCGSDQWWHEKSGRLRI